MGIRLSSSEEDALQSADEVVLLQMREPEEDEVTMGRHEVEAARARSLHVEAGDSRRRGDEEGDAERVALGGAGGGREGRRLVAGEGLWVVPPENVAL
jgi:hypothetical protein